MSNKAKAAAAIVASLAAGAEGLRHYAYYDPPGILTVCRGHTGPDVIKNKLYTTAECDALYAKDIEIAVSKVQRCAPNLNVNQLAAFSDATFNIGEKIVCDQEHSTAARLLKEGKVEEACKQLLRWNRAKVAGVSVELPGLTKRRNAEMQLCLTDPEAG